MAKSFKPGLPDGFTLDVQPVNDLGDYLDEPAPMPQPVRRQVPPQPTVPKTAPVVPAAPPVERQIVESSRGPIPETRPAPRFATEAMSVRPASLASAQAPEPAITTDRGLRPKSPRREISMTPETLRMSDELLELIRRGSGQRDTKANELFHALVLLVFEVKDELDPHRIPKRGRWGTPTARAYPLELKNAFLEALLKKYGEPSDSVAV
jgi:hypothetical protein